MHKIFIFLMMLSFQASTTTYFAQPVNFDADISIKNEEKLISQGFISFRQESFVYKTSQPYNQTIFSNNGKLLVQDDDFKQVMIYENDNSFFLQELLYNKYPSEEIACPNTCFKLNPSQNSTFKEALISLNEEIIDWIRLEDIKGERIFIKFENFKFESSNITYVVPQNYEIINNDWHNTIKRKPRPL